jgi:SAM-dependent methyltransferase
MQYPDAANRDLLDRMPLSANIVLDVGCGAAATGMQYKRMNPNAVYFGIESDEAACLVAAGRIDHIACVDVEAIPLPFGEQRFDVIVYGDVLEHLRDPWAVLQAQVAMLNPGGLVVICMPNVEHWSFAHKLLTGGWDYQDIGLFDRTHLRWFTARSTQTALRAAGLLPYDVVARNFDLDACAAFTQAAAPALQALGVDLEEYQSRAAPLQYVWRAAAELRERLNIVSTMLAPVGGVSHLRVTQPLRALAAEPYVFCRIVSGDQVPSFDPLSPKIFIFHRPLLAGDGGLAVIRQLIAMQFLVVCEFDDHPDFIPVLQRPDVQNFRAVHAVQTSTAPLAEVLGQRNPEIAVFPNAIDHIEVARNYTDPDKTTLFFGGLNRELDWPEWLDALNELAAEFGPRLHFRIVNDEALFDALATEHKSFTPLCDYETYLDLLAQSEVSFMPLLDSLFNRCKSDLKFLEASAARVVSLASPVVYGRVIEDGRTGLIFRNADELKQKLRFVLEDRAAAVAMAEAAREYVARQRMLAYQVADRVAWYRDLWSRRHALNADLLARVPELAYEPETAELSAEPVGS